MGAGLLAGCGSGTSAPAEDAADGTQAAGNDSHETTAAEGEKVFYFGDTTFNAENDESDVNPHNGYSGWACIRYGIGETLFKYSDAMEAEPWLATEYTNVDETTWEITLRDGVAFPSGRALDAQAVKECLDHLTEVHERAAGDLKIHEITADGQKLTIRTEVPVPALINYLAEPYG
ncbi:MAG: ABC transporter substrate-binding protein, partial [Lachnospiraceae bacterium]|nr:ABC transporter substrate-binding protein [Lachnospiraceae bacterium]